MKTRSPYHIHFEDANLQKLEVKLWLNNTSGAPLYEFEVIPINNSVTVDIGEIAKSHIEKTGEQIMNVRYRCDAELDVAGFVIQKTWQKFYRADFGYNKFEDGAQVDSELLKTPNFTGFDFVDGDLVQTDAENPFGELLANKYEIGAGGVIFTRSGLPTGNINFSNFYLFETAGTYIITITFSSESFIQFELTQSTTAQPNVLTVIDSNKADIKRTFIGTNPKWSFIEAFGESDGSIEVNIDDDVVMYSPSVQRYFASQGLEDILLQTNQNFFWKKGEPLKFAYLLNSFVSVQPTFPVRFNYTDGTQDTLNRVELFAEQPSTKEVANVQFFISDGQNVLIPVTYIPCTKQPITKVDFINRFGIRQSLFFYGSNKHSLRTESEDYKSNILVSGGYNINNHQTKEFNKQGKKRIILNSGYYNESFNPVFEELFLSERVWIDDLPAVIVSNSFNELTRLNDDLINYEIDFEFANDFISNIR